MNATRTSMTVERKPRGRGRPRDPGGLDKNQRLRSVDRALSVLSLVAREVKAPLNVISATAGLPASTTHRILETLREHRMVFYDELTQTWSIGVESFRVGQGYARRISFLDVARQLMRDLTRRTDETSSLCVLEDNEVVAVTQIESEAVIRAFMPLGTRSAPHACAAGKCLLAFAGGPLTGTRASPLGFESYTEHTLVDPARLADAFTHIRRLGWSIDDEEQVPGMRCLAAPIFDEYEQPIAALSIAGAKSRMTDHRLESLAGDLCEVADIITHRSGGRHPKWDGLRE